MANRETWARPAESGGEGGPAHPTTPGDAQPYADTDRHGRTKNSADYYKPIMTPQNKAGDPVWGIQAPVGGNPADPEIPVAP